MTAPFQLGGAGPIKARPRLLGWTREQHRGRSTRSSSRARATARTSTPPVTTHEFARPPTSTAGLRDGAVTLSANDPSPLDASPFEDPLASETSGVDKTEYRARRRRVDHVHRGGPGDRRGNHTLEYRSVDEAGNAEAAKSATLKIDGDAPQTTATLDPAEPGAGGTYEGPVDVRLAAQDARSGVATTEYRVDGGEWKTYGAAQEVIYDGSQASRDKWVMAGPGDFVPPGRRLAADQRRPRHALVPGEAVRRLLAHVRVA